MIDVGTKTIETERLLLRKFMIDDAEYMFNNWANDDEVTKYLVWEPHKDIKDTKDYIKTVIDGYNNPKNYNCCIQLKSIKQPIGSIGANRINDKVESATIGYCIGKKWWRMGIMTEALNAIIRFFFNEVKLNRIEARHDVKNPNSGKVMLKCGLKYEGTLRKSAINNQGICDSSCYSILKEEME